MSAICDAQGSSSNQKVARRVPAYLDKVRRARAGDDRKLPAPIAICCVVLVPVASRDSDQVGLWRESFTTCDFRIRRATVLRLARVPGALRPIQTHG